MHVVAVVLIGFWTSAKSIYLQVFGLLFKYGCWCSFIPIFHWCRLRRF